MVHRALPCGDYGLAFGGRLVASVERKSLADLAMSLTSGRLRYALAELAALPQAAVAVEDLASAEPGPTSAEVRAWAAAEGITIPSRGNLGREVWDAWQAVHPEPSPEPVIASGLPER